METLYLVLFGTGAVLAVLSLASGFGHAQPHLPHLHLPGLHTPHAPAPALAPGASAGGTGELGMLNASTITAFVTWFGGAGYLASTVGALAGGLAFAVALLGGLAGASVVGYVTVRLLLPRQTPPLRPEDYRLEGTLARVIAPLGAGRTGEIGYVKRGVALRAVARCADETPLPAGAEVVVLGAERGIATVAPLERLLAERRGAPYALRNGEEGADDAHR